MNSIFRFYTTGVMKRLLLIKLQVKCYITRPYVNKYADLRNFENIRNKDFQFWQQHNHPIELATNEMIDQRVNYIHNNPVEAGFVDEPHAWLHSSARDYASEGKGKIDLIFI